MRRHRSGNRSGARTISTRSGRRPGRLGREGRRVRHRHAHDTRARRPRRHRTRDPGYRGGDPRRAPVRGDLLDRGQRDVRRRVRGLPSRVRLPRGERVRPEPSPLARRARRGSGYRPREPHRRRKGSSPRAIRRTQTGGGSRDRRTADERAVGALRLRSRTARRPPPAHVLVVHPPPRRAETRGRPPFRGVARGPSAGGSLASEGGASPTPRTSGISTAGNCSTCSTAAGRFRTSRHDGRSTSDGNASSPRR